MKGRRPEYYKGKGKVPQECRDDILQKLAMLPDPFHLSQIKTDLRKATILAACEAGIIGEEHLEYWDLCLSQLAAWRMIRKIDQLASAMVGRTATEKSA